MDTLHTVLRAIRQDSRHDSKQETKQRRDHLVVFREFLDTLDRATRRKNPPRAVKAAKGKARGRKR